MLTLKQLPNAERPYEKLEMYGEKSLSNSELLAIILKTGTKNQTAVALAQQVLALIENRNIRALHEISIKELQKINGIGKVKAIQIKAICELAKRMSRPQDLKTQIVKILILNTKNIVQKIVDISIGNTSSAPIERKRIFEEILKTGMSTFILVHNHPSGDVTPSMNDIKTTKEIKMGAELLGLKLLDHIIIGDGKYKSILS